MPCSFLSLTYINFMLSIIFISNDQYTYNCTIYILCTLTNTIYFYYLYSFFLNCNSEVNVSKAINPFYVWLCPYLKTKNNFYRFREKILFSKLIMPISHIILQSIFANTSIWFCMNYSMQNIICFCKINFESNALYSQCLYNVHIVKMHSKKTGISISTQNCDS